MFVSFELYFSPRFQSAFRSFASFSRGRHFDTQMLAPEGKKKLRPHVLVVNNSDGTNT